MSISPRAIQVPHATAREAALAYHALGIAVVPVPLRAKDPGFEGWQRFRFDPTQLDQHFPLGQEQNLACLNGIASGGLADCDLDCAEACQAAARLLPATSWVFGRVSAPRSHYLYRTATAFASASRKFCDPLVTDQRRAVLCELRGSGGLTVLPPSLHRETSEVITWHCFSGTPTEVALDLLMERIVDVAVVSLLARYWPGPGRRDECFKALCGGLLRSLEQTRAERIVDALAFVTQDEEAWQRLKKVEKVAQRLQGTHPTVGWPTLASLLGETGELIVRQVREWLGLAEKSKLIATPKVPVTYRPLPQWVPFPLDTLPPVVREFTRAAAASIGCDPALVALPVLATVAGAIGNSRAVVLKKGWSEPVALWTLTVADSGGHKSPAYRLGVGPLQELQIDLDEAHKEALKQYEEKLEEWNLLPKQERDAKPQPPGEPLRFVSSDATIEALGEILRDNARGVLLTRDELDGWFQSFTRYRGNGASDRSQWLEFHSAGALMIDRLTRERGRLVVRRALASVTGTIQPMVLARALDQESLAAGLGARFLFAMPPKQRRQWTEQELDDDLAKRYQDLLRGLLHLELADESKRTPCFLGLSAATKKQWVNFYNQWGRVQFAAEGEQSAAYSKIEAYAARFMLLHHVVAHVAAGVDDHGAITEASARAGIELARWFASEAQRIYAMLAEGEAARDLRKLVEFIREHGGSITARQLQRSNARKYPTSEHAEAALAALVETGLGHWMERDVTPRGGNRARVLELCPTPDTSDTCSLETEHDQENVDHSWPDTCWICPTVADADHNVDVDVSPNSPESYAARDDGGPEQVSEVSACRTGSESAVCPRSPPGENFARERVLSGGSVGWQPDAQHLPDESATQHAELYPTPDSCSPDDLTKPQLCYRLIQNEQGLSALLAELTPSEQVALDIETTGLDPCRDRVRLLQLAWATSQDPPIAYLIDCFAVDPIPVLAALAGKQLIGHNLTFDLTFLARLGFEPTDALHDTLHLSRVLHAGQGPAFKHGLADCCQRELGLALDKTEQRSDWTGLLTSAQLTYAARDVLVLAPLLDKLQEKLRPAHLEQTGQIETACLPTIIWMTTKGVTIDRDSWSNLARQAVEQADALRDQMEALIPQPADDLFRHWNFDSVVELKRIFGLLGYSLEHTDDATLARIDHPLAGLLRRYREQRKRSGTYGDQWLHHVAADGRVYARWNLTGSESGRMSCSDPNLQQLPRDQVYRRCVIAPPGRVLIKADYSQIELRIAAKISGDVALLEAYQGGEDLHTRTARVVLGKDEVSKQDRQLAKSLNFGLLYGMGVKSFCAYARGGYGVELTIEQATGYRAAFFRSYPGLATWHRRTGRTRSQAMATRTLGGRRRLNVSRFTEKLNTPVQGTGADGLKRALALLWQRRLEVADAFPVLAVHDEIVVEAPEASATETSAWLRQAMLDGMVPLIDPVPVEVEVQVGRTWAGD